MRLWQKRDSRREAMALLACAAMVFLASGLTILHFHKNGRETACHLCHVSHTPTLAAEQLDNLAAPGQVSWNLALPAQPASANPITLDRASRAPPAS